MREADKIYAEMPLPEEVILLKKAFGTNKLYVVGGSVRDFWRSIEHKTPFQPKDFDLVTDLHPEKVIELVKGAIPDILPKNTLIREVGKSFGVILVTINGSDFEIATFREDAKTGDGRRPDYVTFSTIDKDAERRDLTINSLYYDLETKHILDFFGGITDISVNRVRFVGDVRDRVHEDKLRILRFVRFHCRLTQGDLKSIQRDTVEVIKGTELRPEVSDERIRDEFLKGLSSAQCIRSYIRLLYDLNLLTQIFPELNLSVQISPDNNPESIIAQVLRYNNPMALQDSLFSTLKATLLHLRYTAQEVANIIFLLNIRTWRQEKDFVAFKKGYKLVSLDKEIVKKHINLADNLLALRMLEAPYPTVNGNDVMQETGLEGKSLGEEMLRREMKNFRLFLQAT